MPGAFSSAFSLAFDTSADVPPTPGVCYPGFTDWLGCGITEEELAGIEPVLRQRAEMLAWLSLERLTGYRLSLCPTVLRPCAARCNTGVWYAAPVDGGSYMPYIVDGRWYNACGCSRRDTCSCGVVQEVVLPGEVSGPIVVKIDGATLSPGAYRIDNGNRLVRQDGGSWPLCQDMGAPDDQDGTFSVSYYQGVGPDEALSYAAGILALEWYRACTGQNCSLPEGARTVVRQGVTISIPAGIFESGVAGIRAVDNIVAVYNPHRLRTPSRVLSPDQPRFRRRTA